MQLKFDIKEANDTRNYTYYNQLTIRISIANTRVVGDFEKYMVFFF